MSQLTQRAIIETTLRLVEQKPLNKITVRDIVEACGITRNTFYYHFHDIYEVLESALSFEFEHLGENADENCEQLTLTVLHFCITYQRVLYNLYRSIGYEELANYLKKQLHRALTECLQREAQDRCVSAEDLELICMIYEEALVGSLMRFITDPKKEDPTAEINAKIERLRILFRGELTRILEHGSGASVP